MMTIRVGRMGIIKKLIGQLETLLRPKLWAPPATPGGVLTKPSDQWAHRWSAPVVSSAQLDTGHHGGNIPHSAHDVTRTSQVRAKKYHQIFKSLLFFYTFNADDIWPLWLKAKLRLTWPSGGLRRMVTETQWVTIVMTGVRSSENGARGLWTVTHMQATRAGTSMIIRLSTNDIILRVLSPKMCALFQFYHGFYGFEKVSLYKNLHLPPFGQTSINA